MEGRTGSGSGLAQTSTPRAPPDAGTGALHPSAGTATPVLVLPPLCVSSGTSRGVLRHLGRDSPALRAPLPLEGYLESSWTGPSWVARPLLTQAQTWLCRAADRPLLHGLHYLPRDGPSPRPVTRPGPLAPSHCAETQSRGRMAVVLEDLGPSPGRAEGPPPQQNEWPHMEGDTIKPFWAGGRTAHHVDLGGGFLSSFLVSLLRPPPLSILSECLGPDVTFYQGNGALGGPRGPCGLGRGAWMGRPSTRQSVSTASAGGADSFTPGADGAGTNSSQGPGMLLCPLESGLAL